MQYFALLLAFSFALFFAAPMAAQQSLTLLPPFDPTVRTEIEEESGLPFGGMGTYIDAVSADGRTVVGHAQEFVRIYELEDNDGNFYLTMETKDITFVRRDGVMTKLPFFYSGDPGNVNLLGISADGSQIYGPIDETNLSNRNKPLSILENGVLRPGARGPVVPFAHGLQARQNPVGGWIGESLRSGEVVNAVSQDFSTFVGEKDNRATIWTRGEVTKIPAVPGFSSKATGVSADGRVVCGYYINDDPDSFDTLHGFVWTRAMGPARISQMLQSDGMNAAVANSLFITPSVVSSDGSAIYGDLMGTDATFRDYAFKLDLGPFVTITLPDEDFAVDSPFDAEVKVVSTTPQSQTITFPEGLMTSVDGDSELEFEPLEAFILTKEDPVRTFTVRVTPKTYGTLTLRTEATAVSSKGTLNLEAEVPYYINPIKVTLKMKPLVGGVPILNVEVDEAGKVTDEGGQPVIPKVEVTLENLGSKPIQATLQGVDASARDRSAALGRLKTLGTFPIDFPRIVKGTPVKRDIDLEIKDDGRFDFRASVDGRVEGEARGFHATGRGAPLAVGDPYPLKMEIKLVRTPDITNQNNGAIFVKPGTAVGFTAKIKNVTTNSTIRFFGINAAKDLNVLGARLSTGDGNSVNPPFSHDHEVEFGEELFLTGTVRTDANGAPKGTVIWQGLEDIVMVDDATGDEKELTMDDVLVESTVTGWRNNDLAVRVIQDFSNPFPPPQLDAFESAAYFSNAALVEAGEWAHDTIDVIGGIGRAAGNIAGNPSDLADAYGVTSRVLWEMAENSTRTWRGMTDEERLAYSFTVSTEMIRRAAFLSPERLPYLKEDATAALNFARNATYGFFGGMEAAYASNDPAMIAEAWGRVSTNVALEVSTALIPTPKFQSYSKGAEALLLATNLDAARLITRQDNFLRTVKSGLVNSQIVLKGWGIGGNQLASIQSVFRKFKVKGYLRERSPAAFRLIDALAEAVLKPEAMKPKGFSEMDELILDDLTLLPKVIGRNGYDLGLDGVTVIFLPEADDIIAPRVRARLLSRGSYPSENIEEAVKACLKRADDRRQEYADYVPKFEAWAADTVVNGGGIPVPRNYKDNGIPSPEDFADATRGFSFQRFAREGKETMYIPKMKGDDGIFRFISGDIDWIHFTFMDGSPLDSKTARLLYDAMFRCCGLQHPETISWILNKQTVFKGKINQIGEYLNGQKALLEVSGDSTRAVRMNQNLTRFAKDGRDHLIFFEAGIKARTRAALADAQSAFAFFQNLFPDRRVLLPFLRESSFNEALQRAGGSSGNWTYSTADSDALILRENAAGQYERYDGSKWVPWAPAQASRALKTLRTIQLVPTSSLEEIASAGATRINIVNLPVLWPTELSGRVTNWFTAGQTIVIAPGELTQEVHVISATGPLTLTTGLKFQHPKNTMVAVVPRGISISPIPDTASALISTVIDVDRAAVTMIWQSLPGRQYSLEVATAANPGVWSPLLTDLSATESVLTLQIPLADYNETSSYRLRITGITTPATNFKIISFTTDAAAGTATLIWSSLPGREYAVETSPNLGSGSWKILTPTVTAVGQTASLTVPLDPLAKKKFYRLRDLVTAPLDSDLRIVSFTVDPVAAMVTLTWSSKAGTSYTVEFSDSLNPGSWTPLTPRVAATGSMTSLSIPFNPTVKRRFYRVY